MVNLQQNVATDFIVAGLVADAAAENEFGEKHDSNAQQIAHQSDDSAVDAQSQRAKQAP